MDILPLQVEQLQSAVAVVGQRNAVMGEKVGDDLMPQLAQIAAEDQIIVIGGATRVLKMGFDRVIGGRRHSRPHVVGILDTLVLHLSDRNTLDFRPDHPIGGEHHGPCCGGSPLSGGRALIAVLQRHAVLPFCRAEVGGGDGGGIGAVPARQQQRRQRKTFAHGGAGAVQTEKGDSVLPRGKGGADTLVEQIACQQVVQIFGVQSCPFQCRIQRQLLHGAFRFLPAFFTEAVVLAGVIKSTSQRPVQFFPPACGAVTDDHGGCSRLIGLFSQLFVFHRKLLRVFRSLRCLWENMRLVGEVRRNCPFQSAENQL